MEIDSDEDEEMGRSGNSLMGRTASLAKLTAASFPSFCDTFFLFHFIRFAAFCLSFLHSL